MEQGVVQGIDEQFRHRTAALRIPGAVLGIDNDGEVVELAHGVLNRSTGVEVTTDSLFQIGSVTKAFTATLVMQLVDEGRVDLDAPASTYIPGLRFGQGATVRQLLTHTSGVEGDFVDDFGRNDDAIERYVDACAGLEQIVAPGHLYSYCNAGYVVAGRLVEVLTRRPYHVALRERICEPLGLSRTVTLPEEAILHRVAVGHIPELPGTDPKVATVWAMPRSQVPAGSTACSTVGDLLAFARMHMGGGGGVLSDTSRRAMQQPQQPVPSAVPGLRTSVGLGWHIAEWQGRAEVAHTGSTLGQAACLSMIPERRIAVALLTNSLSGIVMLKPMLDDLYRDLAGIEPAPLPAAPETPAPIDLSLYTGTYRRRGQTITVEAQGDRLRVATRAAGSMSQVLPELPALTLAALDDETFAGPGYAPGMDVAVHFSDRDPAGRYRLILHGWRVARRVPE
jgi:CubicO group peptidase (beta-lactamase class C family)